MLKQLSDFLFLSVLLFMLLIGHIETAQASEAAPRFDFLESQQNLELLDSDLVRRVRNLVQLRGGPYDEGTDDRRNNVGTGSTRNFLTYPSGVRVTETFATEGGSSGNFVHSFDCRVRTKDYVFNTERDTRDDQRPGEVRGDYILFGPSFLVSNLSKTGEGRCGDSVVGHLNSIDNNR
ncbi:MAG: hypothetical protein AB4063_00175 [Crocosphaera sp.]